MKDSARLKRLSAISLVLGSAWMANAKSVADGSISTQWVRQAPLKSFYDNAFLLYLMTLIVALAAGGAAVFVNGKTKRRHLRGLLTSLVAGVMNTPDSYGDQDYRVTLFRFSRFSIMGSYQWWQWRRKWRAPWAGWLIAYTRSGEEALKDCTIFAAPDKSQQGGGGLLHGVTGAAWVRAHAFVSQLAIVTAESTPAEKSAYAEKTFLTTDELEKRLVIGKSLAPSIWAERVQLSNRTRWGVIVYDAIDPSPIITEGNMSAHRLGLQAVSLVLEESSA